MMLDEGSVHVDGLGSVLHNTKETSNSSEEAADLFGSQEISRCRGFEMLLPFVKLCMMVWMM